MALKRNAVKLIYNVLKLKKTVKVFTFPEKRNTLQTEKIWFSLRQKNNMTVFGQRKTGDEKSVCSCTVKTFLKPVV